MKKPLIYIKYLVTTNNVLFNVIVYEPTIFLGFALYFTA